MRIIKLNIIKKIGISFLIALGLIGAAAFKKEVSNTKTVAISQIVEHSALDATYRGIVDELESRDYIPGKTINIIYESAHGSPLMAGQIAQKFIGIKPDIMVGIGTIAAQALVSANRNKSIPIVFSSITDPLGAQLVADLKSPGSVVTGISNWVALEPQLQKFKEIVPNLKRLGIIYNPGEGNSVTLVNRLKDTGTKMGIDIVEALATASTDVRMAAESIAHKVDAIFISNDNTALSAFESIVMVANKAGIPVFVSDTDMVERGAVAALGPNQYELGRQTGRMIIEILEGKSPSGLAVGFPEKSELYLNIAAMEAIDLAVPDRLKAQADKIIKAKKT